MNFTVHGADGATLAAVDHIDEALMKLRLLEAAEKILRISDGEVMATKTRFGRRKAASAPSVMS